MREKFQRRKGLGSALAKRLGVHRACGFHYELSSDGEGRSQRVALVAALNLKISAPILVPNYFDLSRRN